MNYAIHVWWPTNGARVSGVHPFKARVYAVGNIDNGLSTTEYQMSWSVDGDRENQMDPVNNEEGPHFRSDVGVDDWTWNFSGIYEIQFKATIHNSGPVTSPYGPVYQKIITPNRWPETNPDDDLTLRERADLQQRIVWAVQQATLIQVGPPPINPTDPAWVEKFNAWCDNILPDPEQRKIIDFYTYNSPAPPRGPLGYPTTYYLTGQSKRIPFDWASLGPCKTETPHLAGGNVASAKENMSIDDLKK
jgi:hypothetical protein